MKKIVLSILSLCLCASLISVPSAIVFAENTPSNTINNTICYSKKTKNKKKSTVYYVTKGKVYHISKGCRTLSRSKNILSCSKSKIGDRRSCNVCS